MPILFCERCNAKTVWVYLGSDTVCCKGCGWQMSVDEFRAYRSRVLRAKFEKFLERKKDSNPLEELYDELKALVQSDEKIAEEVHRRNMKQLEKLHHPNSKHIVPQPNSKQSHLSPVLPPLPYQPSKSPLISRKSCLT